MSIMCCVYTPDGIVLAADSRLTRTRTTNITSSKENDNTEKITIENTTYTLSDNAQKVLLIKKNAIGISFCGQAFIDGVNISDFIRKFEIKHINEEDSTEVVANKLKEYFCNIDTIFFICGYDKDTPYVYKLYKDDMQRINIKNKNIDKAIKMEQEESNQEEICFGATWSGQPYAITKLLNNKPPLNANYNIMPLKDAIDFAEFLIDLTIKHERFCDDIQTCGGPIDILLITKDEALWVKHKIYK